MHNAFLLSDIAPNRKKLELKIVTFCQIVPLIFKFVYLKSGQPNSNSFLENRQFLSYRPPNFLKDFLEISAKVPRPPEKFV